MSVKTHCDICDDEAGPSGGVVQCRPNTPEPPLVFKMDLCRKHWLSLKSILKEWKKHEQGCLVTWPEPRT